MLLCLPGARREAFLPTHAHRGCDSDSKSSKKAQVANGLGESWFVGRNWATYDHRGPKKPQFFTLSTDSNWKCSEELALLAYEAQVHFLGGKRARPTAHTQDNWCCGLLRERQGRFPEAPGELLRGSVSNVRRRQGLRL